MASPPTSISGRHLPTAVPKDILIDVLARVALQSSDDLVNAKLTCKALLDASADDHIYRHVAISKFPVIPWKMNLPALSFLHRCKTSGNPEALFRQGMIDFFSLLQIESGLHNLMSAARSGHPESVYVYGMLMLCQGHKEQGMALLQSLSPEMVRYCRNRVKSVRGIMWVRNFDFNFNFIMGGGAPNVIERRTNCASCPRGGAQPPLPSVGRRSEQGGWASREDEELEFYAVNRCRACFWDHEAAAFCNMFKFGTFVVS